jgi:hypothetical protein
MTFAQDPEETAILATKKKKFTLHPDADPQFVPGILVGDHYWTICDIERLGGYEHCPLKARAAIRAKYLADFYALHRQVHSRFLRMGTRDPRRKPFVEALNLIKTTIKKLEDEPESNPLDTQATFAEVRKLTRSF